MRHWVQRVAVLGFGSVLLACGGPVTPARPPPPPEALAPPDVRPPSDVDRPFVPPEVHDRRLSNGVRLLMVERRDLPLVALNLLVKRGASDAAPGVARLASGVINERARYTRTVVQATRVNQDTLSLRGMAVTRVREGSNLSDRAFWMLARVITDPDVPVPIFERVEKLRDARLQRRNVWDTLAALERSTFYPQAHPYQRSVEGEPSSPLELAAVQGFLHDHVQPDQLVVIGVGDLARESFFDSVARAFGTWRGRARERAPLPEPIAGPIGGVPLVLVDGPELTQAYVRVSARGVRESSPDLAPLAVLDEILGGSAGRLNLSLRHDKASTYGSYSNFWWARGTGLFQAWTSVEPEQTAGTLLVLAEEIARLRDELLSEAELIRAKRTLIRRLALDFATLDSTVEAVARIAASNLPADFLRHEAEKLDAVTSADVRRAARSYLAPEALRWFVVADASKVRTSLERSPLGALAVVPGTASE
jgi:zinc protease